MRRGIMLSQHGACKIQWDKQDISQLPATSQGQLSAPHQPCAFFDTLNFMAPPCTMHDTELLISS
jgi:hypothetical protein